MKFSYESVQNMPIYERRIYLDYWQRELEEEKKQYEKANRKSMSNRLKNIIKQNVSNLLSEDVFGKHNDAKTISKSGSVTHDKVATHSAKASIVIDKIKDNLRSMGVSASDVDGIYTIDQLKSKPFDIKFTVLGKENKWGERKKKDISTKAKYNKPLSESRGTMVLDLKDYGTMVFLKNTPKYEFTWY